MERFQTFALIAVIGVAGSLGVQSAAAADASKAFAALESVEDISLSPDGHRIAFIAPLGDRGNALYIADVEGEGEPHRILASNGDPDRLDWCHWANDKRLICNIYGRDKLGGAGDIYGYSNVVAIDADGANVTKLSARRGNNSLYLDLRGGSVIDWLPSDDKTVLMTRSYVPEARVGTRFGSTKEGLGVDRIDISSARATPVEPPHDDSVEYITDGHGQLRIKGVEGLIGSTSSLDPVIRYFFRAADGSGDWQPLATLDTRTDAGFNPVTVDAASNSVVGFVKVNGRLAAARMPLATDAQPTILLERPDVDVDGVLRVGRDRRVVGFSYATDRRVAVMTDPKLKAMASALSQALGGKSVYFVDSSADESEWLVWAGSDVDPGQYFLFNPAAKQLRPLLSDRPELADTALSPVRAISYPAADGTMIPAYLTLPPGRTDAKGLSAIVMPHGGPSARDEWGFDWLAQYFANRGYAVIQPNFRGSSGYGDSWYRDNGFQSWRTAIGDVADAGRWLVSAQGVDPAKLSIVGWSYGGYAALQSAVLAPDLFKAVVAIAPVTDLALLKTESQRYVTARIVRDFVGNGPHVTEGSPARNAAVITAPVLMFHGTLDQNVDIEQARTMKDALSDAGRRVELIEYPDLSHSLASANARADMLARITAFLPH